MLLDKVEITSKVTVEEVRLLASLSQKEFAEKVNIPYSTYVKKERGETRFLANEISHISIIIGVPIEKIEI